MSSVSVRRCLWLLLAAAAVIPVSPALADSGYVAPREEIPLTSPLGTGVRSLGMGGVGVAVADDATSITTNPACLARLQRIELSGGLRLSSRDLEGSMSGSPFESSISHTDISSIRAAYPFPTFRGSLVMAVAAERVYDFADDRLAAYDGPITWTEPGGGSDTTASWEQVEDYISDGGLYALSAGVAVDVSPMVAVGVAVSYFTGDYEYTFGWEIEDAYGVSEAYSSVATDEQYTTDVSGLRATVGSVFYLSESLSLGLAVDTPMTVTFDGSGSYRQEIVGDSPEHDSVSESSVIFSDKVELPFSFRAGAAYSPVDFVMLGADVCYTDWSEMKYEGPLTETVSEGGLLVRERIYEGTVDYAFGAEVTVPAWPVRLRAGYSSRPIPYRGLDIDSDRSVFTLGAGVLIDDALALDVAWLTSGHERSDDEYEYEESLTERALLLEATYRF